MSGDIKLESENNYTGTMDYCPICEKYEHEIKGNTIIYDTKERICQSCLIKLREILKINL